MLGSKQRLIESIASFGDISSESAASVFDLYLKEKIIKREHGGVSFSVKHGAFLDKEIIQNAVLIIPQMERKNNEN